MPTYLLFSKHLPPLGPDVRSNLPRRKRVLSAVNSIHSSHASEPSFFMVTPIAVNARPLSRSLPRDRERVYIEIAGNMFFTFPLAEILYLHLVKKFPLADSLSFCDSAFLSPFSV